MISIVAEGLTKKFGRVVALKDVDFSTSGRIIAIVGPNGSGKTTLLSIIAGIRYPTSGRLRVNGFEPYRERSLALKRISFAFERPRFGINMSVDVFLDIASSECPNATEFYSAVELFGADSLRSKKFFELSSGQAQLVSLLLALFCDTSTIAVLDEPLAHLDVVYRSRLLDVLYRRGNIVFTTHVLEEAEAIADSAIILDNGAIVWHGEVDKIYQDSVYEVFASKERGHKVAEILADKIITRLDTRVLVKDVDPELLSKLLEQGLIIGYRRAGLRLVLYERYKGRV